MVSVTAAFEPRDLTKETSLLGLSVYLVDTVHGRRPPTKCGTQAVWSIWGGGGMEEKKEGFPDKMTS